MGGAKSCRQLHMTRMEQQDKTHKEQLVSVHAGPEVCTAPALPWQYILTGSGPFHNALG